MMHAVVPGSRSRMRMATALYQQPGLSVTGLIKTAGVSPNAALSYINELVAAGAVREVRSGGTVKSHLRQLFPNLSSEAGQAVFGCVELEQREQFTKKYPQLKPIVKQVAALVGKNETALIYGSYARLTAEKDSDLDILVIGSLTEERRQRLREAVATAPVEVSLKIETILQFRENKPKPLYQNIIREHVIIAGVHNYLTLS